MKQPKPKKTISLPPEPELLARAFSAYFRFYSKAGRTEQPGPQSRIEQHDGHTYVVLRNSDGALAVYRVRNDGILKSLKRWPEALQPKEK
jgi:hypothetical protein